jgi:hypothetical protein
MRLNKNSFCFKLQLLWKCSFKYLIYGSILFFLDYHKTSVFQIGTMFTGVNLFHNVSLMNQEICVLLRFLKTIEIMGKIVYSRAKRFKYLSSLGDSKTKCSMFDTPLTTA